MNYDEASSREINNAVALARGLELADDQGAGHSPFVVVQFWNEPSPKLNEAEGSYSYKAYDFCNNWGDAGRIIEESCISTIIRPDLHFAESYAESPCGELTSWSKDKTKIKRAAMIVYLKMMEAEA